MPYIDKGDDGVDYEKSISKKEEEKLRKEGLKPFDVRLTFRFPKGQKIKVWAKDKDEAGNIGSHVADNILMNPESEGGAIWGKPVRPWPTEKKTRMKRKSNPKRFKAIKIERIHPKTGKKFTQTVYKHTDDWYYH